MNNRWKKWNIYIRRNGRLHFIENVYCEANLGCANAVRDSLIKDGYPENIIIQRDDQP